MHGINDNINGKKSYANKCVGNHFEMMPLDSHLNQDLHTAVDQHAILTKSLKANDPIKFSKRTPKLMNNAYLCIWNPSLGIHCGAPTSNRIIEDISRVVDEVYFLIYKNRGRALHGAHTCSSRRRSKSGNKGSGHGGQRIKQEKEDDLGWVHPSVTHLVDDFMDQYR